MITINTDKDTKMAGRPALTRLVFKTVGTGAEELLLPVFLVKIKNAYFTITQLQKELFRYSLLAALTLYIELLWAIFISSK